MPSKRDAVTPERHQSSSHTPGQENLWHRDWMERTENAYEWWYFDSVSDDGQWSLVVIFLLGSPFSPYSRACELSLNPDPLAYNGVFVALHHRGRLLHYQYARYMPEEIAGSSVGGDAPMALKFGGNSWRANAESGGFSVYLNEENANQRRIVAHLAFDDYAGHSGIDAEPLSVMTEPGHSWLPVVVGGRARCVIELHAPAQAREPERIEFRGSAYHDHNWGTLPFDRSIRQWVWARADFAPGTAAVLYQTVPMLGNGKRTLLLTRAAGEELRVHEADVEVNVTRHGWNGYGIPYPRAMTAKYNGGELQWRFGNRLESTPFYMRCKTDADWLTGTETNDGPRLHGRGIGEMLRPKGMGAWLVSHAMRLRIHEPGL